MFSVNIDMQRWTIFIAGLSLYSLVIYHYSNRWAEIINNYFGIMTWSGCKSYINYGSWATLLPNAYTIYKIFLTPKNIKYLFYYRIDTFHSNLHVFPQWSFRQQASTSKKSTIPFCEKTQISVSCSFQFCLINFCNIFCCWH